MTYGFVGHRQKDLLSIAAGILRGELAASEGRLDEAEAVLRQAIAVEDALAYDEPEPWPIPSRQVLGGVLLDGGRPADAERVFRDDLADYPMNGWSLLGLSHSLRDQGRQEEADAVLSDFERAWERADVWLPSSRF
jgi:tetratricopeptide (TPR) repeat protein